MSTLFIKALFIDVKGAILKTIFLSVLETNLTKTYQGLLRSKVVSDFIFGLEITSKNELKSCQWWSPVTVTAEPHICHGLLASPARLRGVSARGPAGPGGRHRCEAAGQAANGKAKARARLGRRFSVPPGRPGGHVKEFFKRREKFTFLCETHPS